MCVLFSPEMRFWVYIYKRGGGLKSRFSLFVFVIFMEDEK